MCDIARLKPKQYICRPLAVTQSIEEGKEIFAGRRTTTTTTTKTTKTFPRARAFFFFPPPMSSSAKGKRPADPAAEALNRKPIGRTCPNRNTHAECNPPVGWHVKMAPSPPPPTQRTVWAMLAFERVTDEIRAAPPPPPPRPPPLPQFASLYIFLCVVCSSLRLCHKQVKSTCFH
jgi:hypothetical protein